MISLFAHQIKASIIVQTFHHLSMNHSNRRSSFGPDENDPIYVATVQSICNLSPSIKQFYLNIDDPEKRFFFQPGMFLDFHFSPSITPVVTGFSICNTMNDYSRENLVELAIKRTEYPPTRYMFDQCQVNEKIFVKPGGIFTYDSTLNNQNSIILICAGIGANPIVSILRHIRDIYENQTMSGSMPHRVAFFYTAARQEDLVFRASIDRSCQQMIKDNVLRTHYFLTREINDQPETNNRRINKEDFVRSLQWLEKPVTAYLCGPSSFIHWTEIVLTELNIKNIFFEKWW